MIGNEKAGLKYLHLSVTSLLEMKGFRGIRMCRIDNCANVYGLASFQKNVQLSWTEE